MRTPEKRKADLIRASKAAALARSAKKIPSCTLRIPISLKERLEAAQQDDETLADVVSRAMLELE